MFVFSDCFAALGLSTLQSSETSLECQLKYQSFLLNERPKRSRTLRFSTAS